MKKVIIIDILIIAAISMLIVTASLGAVLWSEPVSNYQLVVMIALISGQLVGIVCSSLIAYIISQEPKKE